MAFGIYLHIPYCLQRCPYCDFATYEVSQIPAPAKYLELVKKEIQLRSGNLVSRPVTSIYFGGGTPSLLSAEDILSLLHALANQGFRLAPQCEITIEINPATLDPTKIEKLIAGGVNRFSVGAQTFNDRLLKKIGRKHNATDTRDTLQLLKSFSVNWTMDLLYALPQQSKEDFYQDLEEIRRWDPPHVSAYCLTIPESNPLSIGRPLEEAQVEMFEEVVQSLESLGIERYELSNFAKKTKESRHNLLYWNDDPFWGIGLSSHSYLPQVEQGLYGVRFWNPKSFRDYESWIASLHNAETSPHMNLTAEYSELLCRHESLTDFFHMSLRTRMGLSLLRLENKFGAKIAQFVLPKLRQLEEQKLLEKTPAGYILGKKGWVLSNLVYQSLTFLREDLEGIDTDQHLTFAP